MLRATVGGCGTTELARRLNISLATASHHAAVLRNAHLVTTRREGKAVLHTVTSLGIALLGRSPSPDGRTEAEAGRRPAAGHDSTVFETMAVVLRRSYVLTGRRDGTHRRGRT